MKQENIQHVITILLHFITTQCKLLAQMKEKQSMTSI